MDGVPLKFATDHTRALLAYLVAETRVHERSLLAALLWPDQPEGAARQNLRQTLLYLKQALRAYPRLDELLEITTRSVRFLPEQATVDLHQVRQLWGRCTTHAHQEFSTCPDCIPRLQEATALYQGEFLAGLFVKNSQLFEEWVLLVREQLHRQTLEALTILARAAEAAKDYAQLTRVASRQLALEPWYEDAHRQVMRSLALRGQTTAALVHYTYCCRILAEELGVTPSPETQALYEQIKAGAFDQPIQNTQPASLIADPLAQTLRFPHSLPSNLPPLVGRTESLHHLCRAVLDPTQRLVTLVGMGGIGKTRLALALIEHLVAEPPGEFPHGAWFVPLVGVEPHQPDLPRVLAEALLKGMRLTTSGQGDPQSQLLEVLAGRQLLVVLDNFEHLLVDAEPVATAFIHRLLKASAGITVLVTSRMVLGLSGEQVIRLEGLPVPDGKMTAGTSFESVHLFVQHAQRMGPGFVLDTDNLPDVVEICRLVDGLPLGIELATTLTPHYTGAEIVRAMRESLSALVSTRRDSDQRHRQLIAVFDHSWQMLSPHEQKILAQATIFVGRFSRKAAQMITQTTAHDLIGLVDKSLIQRPAVGLYELHEVVRQFAAERLATFGAEQVEALQARYVQFYLGLITELAEPLHQRQPQALAQVYQVSENCRRAWQLALAHGWFAPLAAAIEGWLSYWKASVRYAEGEALIGAALPVLAPLALHPAASPLLQTLWGQLWLADADCKHGQQHYSSAAKSAEQAIALAQAVGDDYNHARGLMTLAESLSWQGHHAQARPFAERAYALAQQLGAWQVEIRARFTLAWYGENFEQRLSMVAQALQIAQRVGDHYYELLCTQNLAGACENAGYYARSLPYRAQTLQLAYSTSDPYQISQAHYLYGLIHTHLGLYETALEYFQQVLAVAQEAHFIREERSALNRIAWIYTRLGKLDDAYQLNSRARAQIRSDEEPSPIFEFTRGQILAEQGRWAEAALVFQQSLTHKRAQHGITAVRLLPELAGAAHVALRQGEQRQALTLVEEMLEILERHPQFSMSDVYFDLFSIYLAGYRVLQTLDDERATAVLQTGYQKLRVYADLIDDETVRAAYLENVTANRELVAAWQALYAEHHQPASQSNTLVHNLPVSTTPFLGRQREVAELVVMVQQSTSRLITLIGPGGIGKTRLALAVAQSFVAGNDEIPPPTPYRFGDGIFFLSLAQLASGAALLTAIAAALGIQLSGVEPQRKLLQALSDKHLLLVLDNLEHLLPGAGPEPDAGQSEALALISVLLQSVAGLQILVTSRARLNLQGEQLYAVQPLSFSPQASLAAALELEAVQLFLQSARRLRPEFALNETNLPALLRICQLVQGMPLGLEMAAAWIEQLSLDAIAREIARSSDFLTLERYNIPARQRSMRAIFEWSWQLLSEVEQRVLRQLAIFRGDFSYEAAATILGASLPIFTALVNKSLLQRTHNLAEVDELQQIRYELHELLRQFAYEQLSHVPAERDHVAGQHSLFYLNFVAQRAQRLARNQPKQAMAEIQTELDNIRQAWVWATATQQGATQQGATEALEQSAYSFWQFYLQTGLCLEGAQAFQQASEAPGFEGRPELVNLLRAFAAHLLTMHGQVEPAITLAQQVTTVLEQVSKRERQLESCALAHLAWGHACYFQGNFAVAQEQCLLARQDALEGHRLYTHNELFHDVAVLSTLFIGAVARSMGDHQQAKQHFQECLERSQRLGKVRGEIHAQVNLAFTYWLLREDVAARQAYEMILPITRQAGYPWGEGVALYELAIVLRSQGEYSLALAYCQQALPVLRKGAEPLREIYVLASLVGIYCYLGDLNQAERWHTQLSRFRQNFQVADGERIGLLASFHLYYALGNVQQALVYIEQAAEKARQMGSRMYQAEILTWIGHAQVHQQQAAAAEESYRQAWTLYQALGARPQAAEAQAGLAQLAVAAGDLAGAQVLCEMLLSTLADYPRAGIDEPFLVYLTCYEILLAAQDPRAADVLQTACTILQQYAEHIQEAELRVSFLENVASHRQVLAYARQHELRMAHNRGSPSG